MIYNYNRNKWGLDTSIFNKYISSNNDAPYILGIGSDFHDLIQLPRKLDFHISLNEFSEIDYYLSNNQLELIYYSISELRDVYSTTQYPFNYISIFIFRKGNYYICARYSTYVNTRSERQYIENKKILDKHRVKLDESIKNIVKGFDEVVVGKKTFLIKIVDGIWSIVLRKGNLLVDKGYTPLDILLSSTYDRLRNPEFLYISVKLFEEIVKTHQHEYGIK